MPIKKRVMPTDSAPDNETGSNFRAGAGAKVSSSCCAHHTVSCPFTRTCARRIQSTPRATASRARARVAASTAAHGASPCATARNRLSTLTIASSLKVTCV